MPRAGAYYLSEFNGKTIDFFCTKCGKAGSALANDLLAEHGDQNITNFRYKLAETFGCHRGMDAPFNDKCQLVYARPGAELLGGARPERSSDRDRTLGELDQYHVLYAECLACRRKRQIDRWAIQRRFGAGMTFGRIAQSMRCKCGNKGAKLFVGNAPR